MGLTSAFSLGKLGAISPNYNKWAVQLGGEDPGLGESLAKSLSIWCMLYQLWAHQGLWQCYHMMFSAPGHVLPTF